MASVAVFAVGSLGNQYNRVVSWSKKTPAEQLNAKISRLIIAIGIFLTFFAYHLNPQHSNQYEVKIMNELGQGSPQR